MLDPQARAFLDAVAASGRPALESIPLGDARALFEETFTRLGGPPAAVDSVRDIEVPGPHGAIPVRIYVPQAHASAPPLVVYFHGGGNVCGSRHSYDALCRALSRESACILASVDYRLAPEFPAPAPFEDAYAAFAWLATHAAELGADPERVAVGGDSAGGGLAANVALKARDADGPPIAHQLLVYPAVALDRQSDSYRSYGAGHFLTKERMEFYWRSYVPTPELENLPYLLAANATTLRDLPAATILLAECDPLRDQGVAYAERLRADGVPVELRVYAGTIHAFFSFSAIFDKAREAVADAGRALREALVTVRRR